MNHKNLNSAKKHQNLSPSLFLKLGVSLIALIFIIIFGWVVVPEFIKHPDIIQAFASGFSNPFASGYSSDVIACWGILCIWIIHEARTTQVKYGWLCLLLGIVPGVAVGFAGYLLLREQQLNKGHKENI